MEYFQHFLASEFFQVILRGKQAIRAGDLVGGLGTT